MKIFSTTWSLMGSSWTILKENKKMLLFPFLSGVTLVLLIISSKNIDLNDNYLLMFIYYYIAYFIIVFFNASLIASVKKYIDGETPTILGGLKVAFSHIHHIALWVLIASTIGILLKFIGERFGFIGEIISSIFEAILHVATFFVVPVMVLEGKKTSESLNDSIALMKETWGIQIIGAFSFEFIFFLLTLPLWGLLLVMNMLNTPFSIITLGAIAVIYMIFLLLIQFSLYGIFQTAVYKYARFGEIPKGFAKEQLESSFQKKDK